MIILLLQILGVAFAATAALTGFLIGVFVKILNWFRGHSANIHPWWTLLFVVALALAIWQPFAYGWWAV